MKQKVAVIFGGKSAEHEISLKSATNIYNAIDTAIFEPILLGIDKQGNWCLNSEYPATGINLVKDDFFATATTVLPARKSNQVVLCSAENGNVLQSIDAAFPIVHGTYGEDGTLQGIMKSLGLPFAGPDVLGSAIGMDKDVTKRLLHDAGIVVADGYTLYKGAADDAGYDEIVSRLGLPLFVKPANAGSSVGVNKANNKDEFEKAVSEAFSFDVKILVEQAIVGKEVECAVLGNEQIKASTIGEIVPTMDFYSYEAKYVNAAGAIMKIPGDIESDTMEALRATAIKAFRVLCCEGMARIDFFLRSDNTFVLNEINTLPGFTEISMYPKLWEATGLAYGDLITELINLGIERQRRNDSLKVNM